MSALIALGAARAGAQVDEAEPPTAAESVAAAERAATARALFSEGLTHARVALRGGHRSVRPRPGPPPRAGHRLQPRVGARAGRPDRRGLGALPVGDPARGDPEGMRSAAQASVDMLAPRLASVRLVVSGATDGVALLLDGAPLAFAAVGVDVPLDPGPHRFEALRGDARVAVREVELAEGASEEVELAVSPLPGSAPPPIAPIALAEPVREPEPRAEDLSWLAWASGALVVALAVAGITAAILTADQGAAAPIPGTTTPPVLEWD
ncbi:MAG: hypothetical protein M5U28_38465 [Sandaracinaceae bacterium]|nr:hypothetical protein [Sandaracinaceae bacterium]